MTSKMPTDKKGNVKRSYLESINNRRSPVARKMDAKRTSKNTIELPARPKDVEKWVKNPGKMDIRGIDTADEPIKKTSRRVSSRKKTESKPAPKPTSSRKSPQGKKAPSKKEIPEKKAVKVKEPTSRKVSSRKKTESKPAPKRTPSGAAEVKAAPIKEEPIRPAIPEKKPHRQRRTGIRSKMEYSDDWYSKLPWKTDPEKAARMASEAQSISTLTNTDDMLAYLKDCGYGEMAENSRWKYDPRDMAIAYERQKWNEVRMGMYNKKSQYIPQRGELKKISDKEYEFVTTFNKALPDYSHKATYTLCKSSDVWYLYYYFEEAYNEDGYVYSEGCEAYMPESWGTLWTPNRFPKNSFGTLSELVELIDTRDDVFL